MARILSPQCRTAPFASDCEGTSGRLPASLLTEQVRRLTICAAVGAGLWAYGMVMDGLARPWTIGTAVPIKNVAIEAASIVLSAAMLVYLRFARHSAQTKTDTALVYFVLNAAAVALLNNWRHAPVVAMSGLLSWNTVVILVAAMIIPASPSRILIASLV